MLKATTGAAENLREMIRHAQSLQNGNKSFINTEHLARKELMI
jgi:hypothetical protein